MSGDLSGLADGAYRVVLVLTDARGKTLESSQSLLIDRVAPTLSLATIAGDGIINAAEAAEGVRLSGEAIGVEDGLPVTLSISG
ncbi:MAG: hypothetical protein EBS73_14380, partial [Betaproteobacteria bacterium]|nr:hypothetical protein [Betaproteobacteria bacterium]